MPNFYDSRINSFVALLERDGLPGASNLPYFFFDEVFPLTAEDEMLDDVKELESLTVCKEIRFWYLNVLSSIDCLFLPCLTN